MTSARPGIVPFGDSALLVRLEERVDPRINAAVQALAAALRAAPETEPWRPPVPAYASLLAPYDPLRWTATQATEALAELLASLAYDDAADDAGPLVEVPVHYGGEDGPDLDDVAERTGLSPAAVIELHSSVAYRAYMLGFAPGFAYLGTLPDRLRLPRRDNPRPRVPAGSVAIAAHQTAVYPLSTPGGWHIIGRTELVVWDARRDPPAVIGPGARVRFLPSPK